MGKKYKGGCAKNARIKINYEGPKPKVTFSYPDKKNQYSGSMLPIIFMGWWMFAFLVVGCAGIITQEKIDLRPAWEINNTTCLEYQNERWENISTMYSSMTEYYSDDKNKNNWTNNLCGISNISKTPVLKEIATSFEKSFKDYFTREKIFLLLFVIVPPLFIYLPFKKRWADVFPLWQGFLAKKKYVTFKPEDIKTENSDIFCEVPMFKNVILNYKATKDFSKYLKHFTIREHKFKYNRLVRNKEKIKTKRVKQDSWWFARFVFSEKPKNGKLDVVFK